MTVQVYTDHPRELPAEKQAIDWTKVRDWYAGGYLGVFGRQIRLGPLACLLAQSALETGRFRVGCYNFNWGNIKSSQAYADKLGNFHHWIRLNEVLNGKTVWFDPIHPQCRMRGYLTGDAGAAEKIRFLGTASNPARGNRYQRAWDALEDDDPAGFSKELSKAGYYTANEAQYTKGLVSLYREYREKLGDEMVVVAPVVSAPLVPEDYASEFPLHSAASDVDLVQAWVGQTFLGLPDDIHADLAEQKRLDLLEKP